MNKEKITVENAFYNQMTSEELYRFFRALPNDDVLNKYYKSEIIFESQIYTNCRNHPGIKDLNTVGDWKKLVDYAFRGEKIKYNYEHEKITNDGIVTVHCVGKRKKYDRSFLIARYLIAACLVLSVFASGIVLFKNLNSRTHIALDSEKFRGEEKIGLVQSIANVRSTKDNKMQTTKQNGLLYIDRRTAGVVGAETKLTYAKKDTSVYLDIDSGSVLFTVEKGRYRKFTVITKYAKINVTGTIFRVDAMRSFTKVAVIDGSVIVQHANKKDEVRLLKGNVALADTNNIEFYKNEKECAIRLPQRKLLDAFVSSYISEISSKEKSVNDVNYSMDKLIKNDLKIADSVCDELSLKSQNSLNIQVVQKSRMYEKESQIKQAIISDIFNLKDDTFKQILLFRNGALSYMIGDTLNCMKYWESFYSLYHDKDLPKSVFVFLMYNAMEKKQISKADTMLTLYTKKYGMVDEIEQMAYSVGNNYRQNNLFDRALFWYEFILDNYSDNEIRNEAAYWTSWIIIQVHTMKTEKRAFSFISKTSVQ